MSPATLSSKFQILIPKDIQESMNLKPGQKFDFIQIGGSLRVVPQRSMKDIAGVASHVIGLFERDRSDLNDDPELRAAVDARLEWAANTADATHKRFYALIILDSCVRIEVLQLMNTGKYYLPLWNDEDNIIVPSSAAFSATRRCKLLPLNEAITLRGAEIALEYGLAAVDALIHAATLEIDTTLMTCDARFAGLPSIDYQPKLSS